jgi:O-antigen ligase
MFAPVKTLRSVGDSEVDSSTLYRDLENYNLLDTLRQNPFMGTGFGHPFAEVVKLPDISFFKEYRYMPHNSVLGLWAFTGAFGFTGLTFAIVVGVYCAARSYQSARTADERIAAFMVIATVLIYFIQCWGDIGFSERRGIHLLGPALAIAGQLAVSTGAWRGTAARRPRS